MTRRGPPFHRQLHVRIGTVVLLLMAAVASSLLLFSRAQFERSQLEVTQRLNLGLARYVIEHQPRPLLTDQGLPDAALLRDMAMDVMMTNPALEVYLLDASGRILGHALDGAAVRLGSVDLGPVQALLAPSASLALPLLGDDPSAPGKPNVFSATRLQSASGGHTGYLYIVLRGQASQGLATNAGPSGVLRDTTVAVLLACGLALLAMWAGLSLLTRPLRQLTLAVQRFRDDDPLWPPTDPHADEIARLQTAMQAMQDRISAQFQAIEDQDRLRRELIANLSHDLHTPLTCIQGYAEHALLKNELASATERAQSLQVMLHHCQRLSGRVRDLFELSKLDAGRVETRLEVFCLAELLQDIVDGYQLAAQARQVSLRLASGSRISASVRADIGLIERVFQNLIDNALRHTPPGGEVRIELQPADTHWRVSVSDTGRGIASEHLPHVFDRYYRTEPADTVGDGPSAGLGLAIVQRILALHGSAIQVRSELARGTCFDFALQRAP